MFIENKNKKLAIKTKNSQFIHLDGEEFAKAEVNLHIYTNTFHQLKRHAFEASFLVL